MKKKMIAPFLFCLLIMTSCTVVDKLGFDTYNYMSEKILKSYQTDSETAKMIGGLLDVLITDSEELEPFETMNEAVNEYRDAVLIYMLETSYAKYSSNTALLEKARAAYPEYSVTEIIPENEFEATMYEYFGGSVKITHKDGVRFRYLSKIGAYIPSVAAEKNDLEPNLISIDETEKTYRVRFTVGSSEESGREYFALIIKREDGTHYFKKLLYSADVVD